MKTKQKGFGAAEMLIALSILVLLGAMGWFYYDRTKSSEDIKNASAQLKQQEQKQEPKTETRKATSYAFKEFGITMDIRKGWEVKTQHTKEDGVNFYEWTVEKAGADGKIELSSSGFRGGFYGCAEANDPLTIAKVKETAVTKNPGLMFMSWSYDYDNETHYRTGIVPADEKVFRTTNNTSANSITNKEIKAGTYFFCLTEPQAGFTLGLNNEAAPGVARKDRIVALANNSSHAKYVQLPATAKSYDDIKSMLSTIR